MKAIQLLAERPEFALMSFEGVTMLVVVEWISALPDDHTLRHKTGNLSVESFTLLAESSLFDFFERVHAVPGGGDFELSEVTVQAGYLTSAYNGIVTSSLPGGFAGPRIAASYTNEPDYAPP
jgi:hypothetical protein